MFADNSDKNIISYIKQGLNDKAIELLYNKVFAKVKSYLLKNGCTIEDSKDLFHDAILSLVTYVKTKEGEEIKNAESFIMQVVKNLWINKLKSKQYTTTRELINQDIAETDNSEETQFKTLTLIKLMDSLGEKCKEILLFFNYENFKMEEIAKLMDLKNADAAKAQHYRCKQKLMLLINSNKELKNTLLT